MSSPAKAPDARSALRAIEVGEARGAHRGAGDDQRSANYRQGGKAGDDKQSEHGDRGEHGRRTRERGQRQAGAQRGETDVVGTPAHERRRAGEPAGREHGRGVFSYSGRGDGRGQRSPA